MTRTSLALALAAVLGPATLASAETSYFALTPRLERSTVIDLGTVRAEGAGIVNVYLREGGQPGRLLGSVPVTAGANMDVRVPLSAAPTRDVIAELVVNGQIVATRTYDVAAR